MRLPFWQWDSLWLTSVNYFASCGRHQSPVALNQTNLLGTLIGQLALSRVDWGWGAINECRANEENKYIFPSFIGVFTRILKRHTWFRESSAHLTHSQSVLLCRTEDHPMHGNNCECNPCIKCNYKYDTTIKITTMKGDCSWIVATYQQRQRRLMVNIIIISVNCFSSRATHVPNDDFFFIVVSSSAATQWLVS